MQRHPLQRLGAPSRTASMLLHVAGIASFSASFAWLHLHPNAINESWGWHWQFLTIIGLTLAYLSFFLGLLADISLLPSLFAAKNLTAVLSAPLEVLVAILYWGIRSIDKTLIIPPEMELPFLADFGFHAMPAILLALDLLFLSPPWTINVISAGTLSLTLAFLYWGWVELCFSHNGWYPYPLFGLLNTGQRVLLFTFAASLNTAATLGLNWLYGKINSIEKFKKEALNLAKMD